MHRIAHRPGISLVELIAALACAAVVLTVAVPRLGRTRDARAAVAARDATAALIARARALAVAHGSSAVALDPHTAIVSLEAPAGTTRGADLHLAAGFGVTLAVDHATGPTRLDFDGLGSGRLVNRTIRFRRGQEEARLSLSAWGRPRRW